MENKITAVIITTSNCFFGFNHSILFQEDKFVNLVITEVDSLMGY